MKKLAPRTHDYEFEDGDIVGPAHNDAEIPVHERCYYVRVNGRWHPMAHLKPEQQKRDDSGIAAYLNRGTLVAYGIIEIPQEG